MADVAADPALPSDDLGVLRNPSPVIQAALALLGLLVAAAPSVYKPRGMTRYGQHAQRAGQRALSQA